MNDVMIEAQGLSKRYGSMLALSNVSFRVHKGEVLGFLGPNGAGKTTTMKILTCYIAATEGIATVNQCDVSEDSLGARQAIGYLPESTPLYVDMQVHEYLHFMAQMRGVPKDKLNQRIKSVIESTSIGDVLHKEIRQLSKGYRQRVGVAQAIVHEPSVLILDEPMSGLDPNQATEIRDLIREIGRERTVILSTHNLAEVQVTCQRVLIIAKGKLVADDTPDQLQARTGKARFFATLLAQSLNADNDADAVRKAEQLFQSLAAQSQIKVSAPHHGEINVEISPQEDRDLRADIFRAAVESQAVLVGLRRESENLEQIFRQLTLSDTADDAAPADAPSQPQEVQDA